MLSSLSNDRKSVLKSATTGCTLILLLSCTALERNALILFFFAIIGLVAVSWIVPICFSWNRQLTRKEVKSFSPEGLEIKKQKVLYQYFNIEGKEVTPCSTKEKLICLVVSIIITFILIVYPPLLLLEDPNTSDDSLVRVMTIFLIASAAYLIRHGLYFYKNLPIDTSFTDSFAANHPSRSSNFSSNSTSLEHFTSGKYAYLPYNSNNHKK